MIRNKYKIDEVKCIDISTLWDSESLISTASESKSNNKNKRSWNSIKSSSLSIDRKSIQSKKNRGSKDKTKYHGVYWCKDHKKWRVRIILNSKRYHVGYFEDQLEAACAYDKEALRIKGSRTRFNFLSTNQQSSQSLKKDKNQNQKTITRKRNNKKASKIQNMVQLPSTNNNNNNNDIEYLDISSTSINTVVVQSHVIDEVKPSQQHIYPIESQQIPQQNTISFRFQYQMPSYQQFYLPCSNYPVYNLHPLNYHFSSANQFNFQPITYPNYSSFTQSSNPIQ